MLILQATLVVLDFVEILHYSNVSFVDSKARELETSNKSPYLMSYLHFYTFYMRS